jgi:hypothetical protein
VTTACYTCIFGGYDTLKPHVDIPDVDFICFTDDATLAARDDWRVELPLLTGAHPRLLAKYPKILGPQQSALLPYDYTIWVDGSMEIISPSFVDEALADLGPDAIAVHRHSWNDCIYKEASDSAPLPKYIGQPITEQAERYRSLGYPEHAGLWSTGCIARGRYDLLDAAMLTWMNEIERWTVQDQISFPFALWQHGIKPHTWVQDAPGPMHIPHPWLLLHRHADGS